MANLSQTINTHSTPINFVGGVRCCVLTNTGNNPIHIRFSQTGDAIVGEGIILGPGDSFNYESGTLFTGASSAIAVGGSSTLAIFYL